MSNVKFVSLILCVVFLFIVSVGSTDVSGNSSVYPDNGDDNNVLSERRVNTDASMKTFAPDTVMISSGNVNITWDIFYFYLHNTVAQVSDNFQDELVWTEPSSSGELWNDIILAYVIDQAIQFLVYEHAIDSLNITLDGPELDYLNEFIDTVADEAGGLDILERDLRADGFIDLSVYRKLLTLFTLQDKIPAALYGEEYNDLPDEAILKYAEENGYMLAKHILKTFPSEFEDLTAAESDAAKEEAYDKINSILDELSAQVNDENFYNIFSEAVMRHSEDPGSFSSPDGYLFQYYDMVEPFSEACEALDIGRMSGIVETSYGYHIILRLPLNFELVPVALSGSGQYYTLRQLAIYDDYDNRFYDWYEAMEFIHSPELESLNLSELFVWE